MIEPSPAVSGAEPSAATLRRTGFDAQAVTDDRTVVVHLHGELDMATAGHLQQVLDRAMTGGAAGLVLDLAQLTFIDSSGIGVLVGASRRAHREGLSFVLRQPGRVVLKTLRITGVDQHLNVAAPEHPAGQGKLISRR